MMPVRLIPERNDIIAAICEYTVNFRPEQEISQFSSGVRKNRSDPAGIHNMFTNG